MTNGTNMKNIFKVLLVTSGGGFLPQSISIIQECPREFNLLIIGPDYLEERLRREVNDRDFEFITFRFSRRQSRDGSILGSIPAVIFGVMSAVEVILKKRPNAVVSIGHRSASYFLFVARLLGIPTVFVDSLTRVTNPGRTAKLIAKFRLANTLYVQWPKAAKELKGSIYRGRLL